MNSINYQKELEKVLADLTPGTTLLLHACCAPCSSYCLEYLRKYFRITIFFYNPNITLGEEYRHRVEEEKRLIAALNELDGGYPIAFIEGEYHPEVFLEMAKGLEKCPEGGERCFRCYELRLREAGKIAKELNSAYFTTTLSISPLKNAAKLNEIGQKIAAELEITYLPSDFKKKGGYQRSIELSREYALYRQNYCGCAFSKAARMEEQP